MTGNSCRQQYLPPPIPTSPLPASAIESVLPVVFSIEVSDAVMRLKT